MAVPVPLQITGEPLPKPTTVTGLSELAPILASLMKGALDVSLIRGQVGGSEPASDIGPWLPDTDPTWYYWYDSTYGYQPNEQGCPVGTIAIAGNSNSIPTSWLLCDGRQVAVSTYPRLYARIGNKWGGNSSVFNLPPGGVFFINSAGLTIATSGGKQTILIPASALPAMDVDIPYLNPAIVNTSGGPFIPNVQNPGSGGFERIYPVTDFAGNPTGANQQPIPGMPPFITANFVIRYI